MNLIGDYKSHKGNPGLLRSDSMLKAIGKAINIRVPGVSSTKIPIIVIGNTPITDNYIKKVDFLKTSGVIQGFWSLNSEVSKKHHSENTPKLGFQTFNDEIRLLSACKDLVATEMNYFSSMISKRKLGEIIRISSQAQTDIAKAEKFLNLI